MLGSRKQVTQGQSGHVPLAEQRARSLGGGKPGRKREKEEDSPFQKHKPAAEHDSEAEDNRWGGGGRQKHITRALEQKQRQLPLLHPSSPGRAATSASVPSRKVLCPAGDSPPFPRHQQGHNPHHLSWSCGRQILGITLRSTAAATEAAETLPLEIIHQLGQITALGRGRHPLPAFGVLRCRKEASQPSRVTETLTDGCA